MPIDNDELRRLGYELGRRETRGIYGMGPWHPRVYHAIRYCRDTDGMLRPEATLAQNLDVIVRNAYARLDDIAQDTAAELAALERAIDGSYCHAVVDITLVALGLGGVSQDYYPPERMPSRRVSIRKVRRIVRGCERVTL